MVTMLSRSAAPRPQRPARAFYRSATFRASLIAIGFVSAWSCIFGPAQWRSTPSLLLVRSYGLPWWAWGLAFLAFAGMLCLPDARWHVRADWLGLFLYGIVWLSVVASIRASRPANLIITGLAFVGLVALYQSAKLATFDREGL